MEAEKQTDLDDNPLENKDELKIIYDGPSFDGQMEISNLTKQLGATEYLIREIVSEYYRQRGFKDKPEVKIYLKLNKGSFVEWISVIFNHDLLRDIVAIVLGELIFHFLMREKNNSKISVNVNMPINIERMTNDIKIVSNLEQMVSPLEKEGDQVRILSVKNPKLDTKINFDEKSKFRDAVRELKDKIDIEISLEDFFGNLLDISLSKHKYGFLLEESSRVIPVNFDKEPSVNELRKIFTERLKIKARATRKDGRIEVLDIISYEIKERKTLDDFNQNDTTNTN